jgi:large subunit ribosomal protein L19
MSQEILNSVAKDYMKTTFPEFQVGDSVKVTVLIREGNKERNQKFEGTVIAVKGGGINKSFTVRRIFQGVAIERTFMVHSPKVTDLKVVRKGRTRRAKLYYMRQRIGTKASRLKEDSSRIAREFKEKLIQQEQAEKTAKKAPKKEAEPKAEENSSEEATAA